MAYTGEKSVVGSPNDAPPRSRLDYFILGVLICLVFVAYAPVLLWPHWGMFSDATQIIQNSRVFWQDPSHHFDLLRGYWRPGFHMWDLIVWGFAPANPFAFYLFRALCFCGTVCLTYKNSLMLSRSRVFSSLAAAFWLLTGATYEVLYTLDKGETYIALIFAVFLRAYLALTLSGDQPNSTGDEQPAAVNAQTPAMSRKRFLWLGLAAVVCLWGMFTKETTQVLLVFVVTNALMAVACTAQEPRKLGNQAGVWTAARRTGLLAAVGIFSLLTYKLYFYTTGGGNAAAYITLGFSAKSLLPKWLFYWSHLSEYFILLGFCALGALASLPCLLTPARHDLRIAFSLTATALAGALTFFCLPTYLIYAWFPFYALLLPACAYFIVRGLERLPGDNRAKTAVAAGAVLAADLFIAHLCWYQAQVQFQMDSLLQELTAQLADYGKVHKLRQMPIILPFFNPEQAELGERIQFYIADRIYPNYREASFTRDSDAPYQLINLVRYNDPAGRLEAASSVQAKPYRLVGDSDIKLAEDSSSSSPGLKGYSFWSDTHKPGVYWTKQDIMPRDLFLIPFGDLPEKLASYRGAGWFLTGWRDKMVCLPLLQLQEVFTLTRQIQQSKGRTKVIGWKVMEVVSSPGVSWNINLDGWMENPVKILVDSKYYGKTLVLHCDIKKYSELNAKEGADRFPIELNSDNEYRIPIKAGCNGVLDLFADQDKSHPDRRPLLLHLNGAKIE